MIRRTIWLVLALAMIAPCAAYGQTQPFTGNLYGRALQIILGATSTVDPVFVYRLGVTNVVYIEKDGNIVCSTVNGIDVTSLGSPDIEDVTGLTDALAGKSDTGHTHSYLPLSGGTLTSSLTVQSDVDAYGDITAQEDAYVGGNLHIADVLTGKILFGTPGYDTNLYRSAANTLKTDDDFYVGSFNVGSVPTTYMPLAGGTFVGNVTLQGYNLTLTDGSINLDDANPHTAVISMLEGKTLVDGVTVKDIPTTYAPLASPSFTGTVSVTEGGNTSTLDGNVLDLGVSGELHLGCSLSAALATITTGSLSGACAPVYEEGSYSGNLQLSTGQGTGGTISLLGGDAGDNLCIAGTQNGVAGGILLEGGAGAAIDDYRNSAGVYLRPGVAASGGTEAGVHIQDGAQNDVALSSPTGLAVGGLWGLGDLDTGLDWPSANTMEVHAGGTKQTLAPFTSVAAYEGTTYTLTGVKTSATNPANGIDELKGESLWYLAGHGQDDTENSFVTGGAGGYFVFQSGRGGDATTAESYSMGGPGGKFVQEAGRGGHGDDIGGEGGEFILRGGDGGDSTSAAGGAGGNLYLASGLGGTGGAENGAHGVLYLAVGDKTRIVASMSGTSVAAVGSNSASATSTLDVQGDIETGSANAFYFGDPTTNGTWRITRDGNNLVTQLRVTGSWVTKQTITP